MLPKLDAALAPLWAPFLLAAVLAFRVAVGATLILLIVVCTAAGACRAFLPSGAARTP